MQKRVHECFWRETFSFISYFRCALGYYGSPLVERGSCQPCECDHGYGCDPQTGGKQALMNNNNSNNI